MRTYTNKPCNYKDSLTEFWIYASLFLRIYSILAEIYFIVVNRLFARMLRL